MIIAITVSTNYSDLIPFVLEANDKYFYHWYWITDEKDTATISLLSESKKNTMLFYNFKNNGRTFDKGGALRMAQELAHAQYPNSWYAIIDSDIALYPEFANLNTEQLDPNTVYGIRYRHVFHTQEEYKKNTPTSVNHHENFPIGFFQLYKKHHLYKSANNAGKCDCNFRDNYQQKGLLDQFNILACSHLGPIDSYWNGNRIAGFWV